MSKLKRQQPIQKPIAMQLFHEEINDGIRVRVYASLNTLIFRIYLMPGKCVQLLMDKSKFMEYRLSDLIAQAMKESYEYLPEDIALAPKPIVH